MIPHLSEDDLVALLHGVLVGARRKHAADHLATCTSCAARLAQEAALDEVVWEARAALPAPQPTRREQSRRPDHTEQRPPRSRALHWFVGASAAAGGTAVLAQRSTGDVAASMSTLQETTAISLLAWHNVVFLIPLVVGIVLALGSALGEHDTGHEIDGGHDLDHVDHDDGGLLARALLVLGVGRVPLLLLLMIASLIFGGIGLIANAIFLAYGLPLAVYAPLSLSAAAIGMVVLTGTVARRLEKLVPSVETYRVAKRDFEGCTGTLLLLADATQGYAQIKDAEGNVHNIRCRTRPGTTLAKGAAIVVVELDEETQLFLVDENPL